jgi:hypothetical protein
MKAKKLIMLMVGIVFLATSVSARAGLRERHEAGMQNVRNNFKQIESTAKQMGEKYGSSMSKVTEDIGKLGGPVAPITAPAGKFIGKQVPEAVSGLTGTIQKYYQGFKRSR